MKYRSTGQCLALHVNTRKRVAAIMLETITEMIACNTSGMNQSVAMLAMTTAPWVINSTDAIATLTAFHRIRLISTITTSRNRRTTRRLKANTDMEGNRTIINQFSSVINMTGMRRKGAATAGTAAAVIPVINRLCATLMAIDRIITQLDPTGSAALFTTECAATTATIRRWAMQITKVATIKRPGSLLRYLINGF